MMPWLWRGVQYVPLIGVAVGLRLLPHVAVTPRTGIWLLPWRLDPLTLVFLICLGLAVALPPLTPRAALQALVGLILLVPATLAEHVLALPLALLLIGALVRNWRWALAAILLGVATGLLRAQSSSSWNAASINLTAPIFLLLLAATYAGINGYPISLLNTPHNPARLILQPIWLLPLLRTIGWGPWSSGWALACVVLGGATAVWASATALWATSSDARTERITTTWLGMALACIGALTPVGVAAALLLVLGACVSFGLLLRSARSRLWAAPVPPSIMFAACWLAQGAAAASGTFLLSGVLWLATLFNGIAVFRLTEDGKQGMEIGALESANQFPIPNPQALGSWFLVLGSVLLGVLAPLPLRLLIMPAVEQLQGGLTPFGLIDIWPWVGVAALDAGQRRVAVLPSIAVMILALVAAALAWLLARLFGWIGSTQANSAQPIVWEQIRARVWWAGRARRGE